jgi:type I restriction enzyme M protein
MTLQISKKISNPMTMRSAFSDFDKKYADLQEINAAWYKEELGVISYGKPSPTRSLGKGFSEEYIRARFVYALISSGKYAPEYLCIEAQLPKGNGGKSINPDILAFKTDKWLGSDFNSSDFRKNMLVVLEAKRDAKMDTKTVIEKQLRTSMNEYEGTVTQMSLFSKKRILIR